MDPKNLMPNVNPNSPGPSMKSDPPRLDPTRASRTYPFPRINIDKMRAERDPDIVRSLAISTSHCKYITPAQCEILIRHGMVTQGKKFQEKKGTPICLNIKFLFMFIHVYSCS